MKNICLFLIFSLLAFNSYSQCNFATQLFSQSSCDTTCNSFFEVTSTTGPGNYYLFINGSFHSQFMTSASVGPVCPNAIYDIMVTDSVNCNFLDSIWMLTTPGINITVSTQNTSCAGCVDGSATIFISGGTPPYFTEINGIVTATTNPLTIIGLGPGAHAVSVVDANGCMASSIFNINVGPIPCTFTQQTVPQTSCDTSCNSLAFYVSNGGFGPYYLFLNGAFVTMFTSAGTIGGLCPGTLYNIFITDSLSCNFTDTLYLFPLLPFTGAIASQPPTCAGCNDGYAVVTVTGGTPPYTVSWSNGATGFGIQGLSAGIYCAIITDAAGCTITLCDTLGSQTGFSLISGNVFLDLDTNGLKNSPEPGLPNMQIVVNPGGYTGFTSASGVYFISVPNGSYNVSLALPANWLLTSTPVSYNLTVNDNVYSGNDFGVLPDTATPSANLYITSGIPRCNWTSYYNLNYKNTGLMIAEGQVIFNLDPLVSFVSSTPPPTNISGNTYTWAFNNLYPYVIQSINILVSMPATPGLNLNSSAIINLHDNLSNVIFSDTVYKTQTVTCAYDPNDKQMIPEGITAQNIVPLNTIGDYTIRFQNTGNDTAFVVILKDTLSGLFDLGTFEIIAASHEMYAQMDPGGILTFTFDNILLPDSNVNEPGSHGFVRYRIKPLAPVADPTVITNTAYIYFDQNPAVVTNTTLTTFSDNLLSVADIKGGGIINAYPNPFNDEVVIEFEKNMNAKADLYDYQGRITKNYAIFNTSSFVISRGDLPDGLYLLKITTDDGSTTLKLIVK